MGRFDLADQRAFATGQAVFALADAAAVVTITGPDALQLVAALTTLPPDLPVVPPSGQNLLALDAQGHIKFGITALPLVTPPGLVLLTDAPGSELAQFLNARRFRSRVEIQERPDWRVLLLPAGSALPELKKTQLKCESFSPLGLVARESWPKGGPVTGPCYAPIAGHPGTEWTGVRGLVYPEDLDYPSLLKEHGYRPIDPAALEALRIAAWRPLATREAVDGKTLPHELDWLRNTTPLNSGCYPGQEAVAKIVNWGRPPRRLVFLHLDGSDSTLPERGAVVRLAGEAGNSVGHVTSVALHHQLGPIALGLVKRTTPADEVLAVQADGALGGWLAANQTVIVPVAGESDSRPERRLRPSLTRSVLKQHAPGTQPAKPLRSA